MAYELTDKQHEHLTTILQVLRRRVTHKYTRGAAEHGGNIWDQTPVQLIDNAIDECTDQIVYLITLKQKLLNLNTAVNLGAIRVEEDIETEVKDFTSQIAKFDEQGG